MSLANKYPSDIIDNYFILNDEVAIPIKRAKDLGLVEKYELDTQKTRTLDEINAIVQEYIKKGGAKDSIALADGASLEEPFGNNQAIEANEKSIPELSISSSSMSLSTAATYGESSKSNIRKIENHNFIYFLSQHATDEEKNEYFSSIINDDEIQKINSPEDIEQAFIRAGNRGVFARFNDLSPKAHDRFELALNQVEDTIVLPALADERLNLSEMLKKQGASKKEISDVMRSLSVMAMTAENYGEGIFKKWLNQNKTNLENAANHPDGKEQAINATASYITTIPDGRITGELSKVSQYLNNQNVYDGYQSFTNDAIRWINEKHPEKQFAIELGNGSVPFEGNELPEALSIYADGSQEGIDISEMIMKLKFAHENLSPDDYQKLISATLSEPAFMHMEAEKLNPEDLEGLIWADKSKREDFNRALKNTAPQLDSQFETYLVGQDIESDFSHYDFNITEELDRYTGGDKAATEKALRNFRVMKSVAEEKETGSFREFVGESLGAIKNALNHPATKIGLGALTVVAAASPFGAVMGGIGIARAVLSIDAVKEPIKSFGRGILNFVKYKWPEAGERLENGVEATGTFLEKHKGKIGVGLALLSVGAVVAGNWDSIKELASSGKDLAAGAMDGISAKAGIAEVADNLTTAGDAISAKASAGDVAGSLLNPDVSTVADAVSAKASAGDVAGSLLNPDVSTAASAMQDKLAMHDLAHAVPLEPSVASELAAQKAASMTSAMQDKLAMHDLAHMQPVTEASSAADIISAKSGLQEAISNSEFLTATLEGKGQVLDIVDGTAMIEVTANKGDSLWKITEGLITEMGGEATDTNIANMINKIADANGLSNPNLIQINEGFIIPVDLDGAAFSATELASKTAETASVKAEVADYLSKVTESGVPTPEIPSPVATPDIGEMSKYLEGGAPSVYNTEANEAYSLTAVELVAKQNAPSGEALENLRTARENSGPAIQKFLEKYGLNNGPKGPN